jgi:hypothetical protein
MVCRPRAGGDGRARRKRNRGLGPARPLAFAFAVVNADDAAVGRSFPRGIRDRTAQAVRSLFDFKGKTFSAAPGKRTEVTNLRLKLTEVTNRRFEA